VVHPAEPLAEGLDRSLVGEVDGLGADAGLAGVGTGQGVLVAAGRDDVRPASRAATTTARAIPLPRPMISTVLSFREGIYFLLWWQRLTLGGSLHGFMRRSACFLPGALIGEILLRVAR